MTKILRNSVLSVGLLFYFPGIAASPFDSCPSQAFLVQESVSQLYGADLSTGYVELLSDNLGTIGKVSMAHISRVCLMKQ